VDASPYTRLRTSTAYCCCTRNWWTPVIFSVSSHIFLWAARSKGRWKLANVFAWVIVEAAEHACRYRVAIAPRYGWRWCWWGLSIYRRNLATEPIDGSKISSIVCEVTVVSCRFPWRNTSRYRGSTLRWGIRNGTGWNFEVLIGTARFG